MRQRALSERPERAKHGREPDIEREQRELSTREKAKCETESSVCERTKHGRELSMRERGLSTRES